MEVLLDTLPIALPMLFAWWAISIAWQSRAHRSRRGVLMTYSWLNKLLAIGSIGFIIAIIAIMFLPINRTVEGLKSGAIALAVFVPPTGWLFHETMRRKILVTSNEVVSIQRRGRRKRIRFREVVAVTGGAFTGGFHVRSIDGRRIGVSHMLVGQREFARMVLERVPAERVHCVEILQRILEYK